LHASQERKSPVFAAMKNPAVTTTHQAKARESIEAFVEFVERNRVLLGSGKDEFPLSPALSPREREPQTEAFGFSQRRATIPPLPGGEGRGEGEQIERALHSSSGSLAAWADHFLDEIGYFAELKRSEKTPEASEARIRNLKELVASLDGVGSAGSLMDRLQLFLEEITLDEEREEEDEGPDDAVTLITMHSCKGLEFPHVYIVGLEDGLLPHARSKAEGTLDEERRLFYVAITRAMHTLTISHCGARKKYGQPLPCHPSRFLGELPEELVEHADENAKQPVTVETGKNMFATLRGVVE
jgi:superfamily I DNA/RNA helicase